MPNEEVVGPSEGRWSPFLATVLLVGITVVLAAFVAVWLIPASAPVPRLADKAFVATAVDMPSSIAGADADALKDSIQVSYLRGPEVPARDVRVFVDGAEVAVHVPTGAWTPGMAVYVQPTPVLGPHLVKVSAGGEMVLETTVTIP